MNFKQKQYLEKCVTKCVVKLLEIENGDHTLKIIVSQTINLKQNIQTTKFRNVNLNVFLFLPFFILVTISNSKPIKLSSTKMAACVYTVSQNGTGDFQTVQEAIDAVPLGNSRRTVIRVSPGIYKQPVYVPKTKNFITLAGLCREDTVLTWNNTSAKIDHHQVCFFSLCFVHLG